MKAFFQAFGWVFLAMLTWALLPVVGAMITVVLSVTLIGFAIFIVKTIITMEDEDEIS